MKYIQEYMEEELKLKPLGKVDFEELGDVYDGGKYGYSVLINYPDNKVKMWAFNYSRYSREN